jgi:hypothetical protein
MGNWNVPLHCTPNHNNQDTQILINYYIITLHMEILFFTKCTRFTAKSAAEVPGYQRVKVKSDTKHIQILVLKK